MPLMLLPFITVYYGESNIFEVRPKTAIELGQYIFYNAFLY